MKLEKNKNKENGYLLLESLLVLTILVTLVLLLYPLIVDWFILKEKAKVQVEQNRLLYESSMGWQMNQRFIKKSTDEKYKIQIEKTSITVIGPDKEVGVKVYESNFE